MFTGDDPNLFAVAWTMEGTFINAFEGIPATGKTAVVSGVDIAEFNDAGLPIGITLHYNAYAMWEQYGLVPKMGGPAFKGIVMAEMAAGKTKAAAGKAMEAMHL